MSKVRATKNRKEAIWCDACQVCNSLGLELTDEIVVRIAKPRDRDESNDSASA
jgi:prophage antirepressor-like protein